MVIAIDGPGGVGKTTVTQAVARRLGYQPLDTGATYRAATVAVLRAGAPLEDHAAVTDAVREAAIEYDDGVVTLDGDDVTEDVRSAAVTAAVSAVSAIPEVRETIVEMQRRWVADRNGRAVVEGRDIGTVVFPGASVKVFLTARTDVRAARRAGDDEAGGQTVDEIEADLRRRDHADSTRDTSPLHVAPDAVTIDTSDLSVLQVVTRVVGLVEQAEMRTAQRPL